jgi:hypothetical protein
MAFMSRLDGDLTQFFSLARLLKGADISPLVRRA